MQIEYIIAQSATRPLEIDVESSPYGVYIRRDIKEIEQEIENADGEIEKTKMFEYQEAFLSHSEYEIFSGQQVANNINGNENSTAFENYQKKLDTPVVYPANGFLYKPKWAEGVYAGLLQKGALLPVIFPLKIYDATETEENAAVMTMEELIALTVFLAQKQEEFFQEYKKEKVS